MTNKTTVQMLSEWAHKEALELKDTENFIKNRLTVFIRLCEQLNIKKANKHEALIVYHNGLLDFLKVSRQQKYYLKKISKVSIKTLEAIKNDL